MHYPLAHALLREGLTKSPPRTGVSRFGPADPPPWLSLTEFGYERFDDASAIVRLIATLDRGRGVPADAALLVERRRARARPAAVLSSVQPSDGTERRAIGPAGCLLWEVSFDLPLEVVQSPRALFTLTASNGLALALPAPRSLEDLAEAAMARGARRFAVARIRRHAVAFTAGVAIAVATGSAGSAALAGTVASTDTAIAAITTTPTTDTTTTPTTSTDTTTTPTTSTDTTTTPTTSTDTTTTPTTSTGATTTPTDTTTTPTVTTPALTTPTTPTPTPTNQGAALTGEGATTTTTPAAVHGPTGTQTSAGAKHSAGSAGSHRAPESQQVGLGTHGQSGQGKGTASKHPATRHRAKRAAPPASAVVSSPTGLASPLDSGLDPFTAALFSRLPSLLGSSDRPPAFLIPIYKAASRRYHVPWQILAAINAIETNYGRDLAVSSAGAIGWMQFMPGTWRAYGTAAHGVHQPNPWNPADAIFSAARYLAANGAPQHIRRALFAYNHAPWYVEEVVWTAQSIVDRGLRPSAKVGLKLGAMRAIAEILNGDPYVWGGGHSGWTPNAGYDCSGFVSAVLHAGGYLSTPATTQALVSSPGISSGPGKYVTIFDRTDGGSASQDHVIIDLDGQWWESGGSDPGNPGVHRMPGPSASYLAGFNRILHPDGL